MGILSPLSKKSFEHMQLNAGVFLVDFDYSTYTDADKLREGVKTAITDGTKLLGATRGGGTFVATPETRSIEVDGKRYEFVGSTVVDTISVKFTGTMLEITPDNFRRTLASGRMKVEGNKTTVTMDTALGEADYIKSLVWVGEKIDGTLMLIALKNALNTNGLTLTFTDKGEGTIPFEFTAHQSDVNDSESAPFEAIFFGKAAK